MHIFGAQMQAKPGQGGATGQAAAEIRDAVSALIGRPVYAWAVVAGAPVGSFAVSTRLDGVGDLVDMNMKLATDGDYQQLAAKFGDLLVGPAETNLSRVIGMAGEIGDPAPVIQATSATVAGGRVSDAMAWCHSMLEHAVELTGIPTMLATRSAGSFFDIGFIGGGASGAVLDEANEKLMGDAGYVERLDQAGGMFVDGTVNRVIMAQLP